MAAGDVRILTPEERRRLEEEKLLSEDVSLNSPEEQRISQDEADNPEPKGFFGGAADELMGAVGGFNEPFLGVASTLEHLLTGNGNWVDPQLADARRLKNDSAVGGTVGEFAGNVALPMKMAGTGAKAMQKLGKTIDPNSLKSIVGSEFTSEMLRPDGDAYGDQDMTDRLGRASVAASMPIGVDKVGGLARNYAAGGRGLELPESTRKLLDEGAPLTSRTLTGYKAPLDENQANLSIDAALRWLRQKTGFVEAFRSSEMAKPARIKQLAESTASRVRDGDAVAAMNADAFKNAIPDIDGAAARVGEFDGFSNTFKRLNSEVTKGYDDAFEDSVVSDTTKETFKRMRGAFKKMLKDKAFSKDETEVMETLKDVAAKVGKGGEENLPKLYMLLKDLRLMARSQEVRDLTDITLNNIRSDLSEDATALLNKLDKSYPNYVGLREVKGSTALSDMFTLDEFASASNRAGVTDRDFINKDFIDKWQATRGAPTDFNYKDLQSMKQQIPNDLARREKKFEKLVNRGQPRTSEENRERLDALIETMKKGSLGL